MVNYLGKFIPNVAEHTTPLRNLLKKDVVFGLQKPQLEAIENLKTLVTSAPWLEIFDTKLPTRLKTDLAAFLEQIYGTADNEKWLREILGTIRKTLRTGRKKTPLYSSWTRMLSWVFALPQIYLNQWSQTIKVSF